MFHKTYYLIIFYQDTNSILIKDFKRGGGINLKVNILCPYCKKSFRDEITNTKKSGTLYSTLIKKQEGHEDCGPFLAFIDTNGMHRGSQKIDHIDDADSEDTGPYINNALNNIDELDEKVRFYHLKIPKKKFKRSFDHKVASVKDRAFMSSRFYKNVFKFLSNCKEENTFGMISLDSASKIDGTLVYGKYLGVIYILYWNDQKKLKNSTLDEIKGYTNLIVEKLIELYELMDLIF